MERERRYTEQKEKWRSTGRKFYQWNKVEKYNDQHNSRKYETHTKYRKINLKDKYMIIVIKLLQNKSYISLFYLFLYHAFHFL